MAHVRLEAQEHPLVSELLSPELEQLMVQFSDRFSAKRVEILEAKDRLHRDDHLPNFIKNTTQIRKAMWSIHHPQAIEQKKIKFLPAHQVGLVSQINRNEQILCFDFEDYFSPAWHFQLKGIQLCLQEKCWIRVRGLESEERHLTIDGKPFSASFLSLLMILSQRVKTSFAKEDLVLVIPKLESHLESRFWQECLCAIEELFQLRKNQIKIALEFETVQSVLECYEHCFELKERLVAACFDSHGYIWSWLKTMTHVNRFELPIVQAHQWSKEVEKIARTKVLKLCRDLKLSLLDGEEDVTQFFEQEGFSLMEEDQTVFFPVIALDSDPEPQKVLSQLIKECLIYLETWLGGVPSGDFSDFELKRTMIWQWIKQGSFDLETFKRLRAEVLHELRDPLSYKSDRNFFEATRVLDGLILNRYITEDAKPLALQWLKG